MVEYKTRKTPGGQTPAVFADQEHSNFNQQAERKYVSDTAN